jgi:hypothetical protein
VASPGAAEENRRLVADELAAGLVKTGGRLVKHARYYWLLLADGKFVVVNGRRSV